MTARAHDAPRQRHSLAELIRKPSLARRKLRGLALRLLARVENNGEGRLDRNGEGRFLDLLLDRLAAGGSLTLFDVGANVGEYAAGLRLRCRERGLRAELHLFEPMDAAFAQLTSRFADAPDVVLNHAAASDADGASPIYFDHESSTLASLYPRDLSQYDLRLARAEQVRTTRLDGYLRDRGIEYIHFLKLDVEGHELTVLRGLGSVLRDDRIGAIQFEYGGANVDARTFLRDFYILLEERGFAVGKIMRDGRVEIRPYRSWMENFSYANYVALSRRLLDAPR